MSIRYTTHLSGEGCYANGTIDMELNVGIDLGQLAKFVLNRSTFDIAPMDTPAIRPSVGV